MKKFYRNLSIFVIIFILVFASLSMLLLHTFSSASSESYQKGFVYQYRALQHADPDVPKVILIGGSYMTFSTDTAILSQQLSQPVYSLGIHSGMGMSYIFETAEKFANPGDTVIFPYLEFPAKEYGMDLILLGISSEPDIMWDFFKVHPLLFTKSIGSHCFSQIYIWLSNNIAHREAENHNVYTSKSFDPKSGNLIFPRPEAALKADDNGQTRVYHIDDEELECIKETNRHIQKLKDKNVQVYMMYAPNCKDTVLSSTTEIEQYQVSLEEKIEAPFIGTLDEVLYPMSYMFDGIPHLNDIGKEIYTKQIIRSLTSNTDFFR